MKKRLPGRLAFGVDLVLGFLSQNVTVKSVLSFDFTCSGKGKPFFRTGVSLPAYVGCSASTVQTKSESAL